MLINPMSIDERQIGDLNHWHSTDQGRTKRVQIPELSVNGLYFLLFAKIGVVPA
jgi:hypothetical protein